MENVDCDTTPGEQPAGARCDDFSSPVEFLGARHGGILCAPPSKTHHSLQTYRSVRPSCRATMRMRSIFPFVVGATFAPRISARSWTNLVDPVIFLASAIDYGRLEKSLERDPFDFTNKEPATEAPTSLPTQSIQEALESPTIAPTRDSPSPSLSPTARYENIVGNGGCSVEKDLYRIRMVDDWGDGWDDTFMRIVEVSSVASEDTSYKVSKNGTSTTSVYSSVQVKQSEQTRKEIFRGRLVSGSEGYRYACLKPQICYSVEVDGGSWESEIKWEIRRVELGSQQEQSDDTMATAKGLAPEICQFSIVDAYGGSACPLTCGMKRTASPTKQFAPAPSSTPTATLTPTVPAPTTSFSGQRGDDDSVSDDDIRRWRRKRNRNNDDEEISQAPSDVPSTAPSQQPRKAWPWG